MPDKVISLIVARSQDNVIGYENQLPWRISADLKYFKIITMGHAIIMGRKTYESIGRPLPKRRNMVISRTIQHIDGCEVFSSLESAIEAALTTDPEPIVIGGASIYQQALPLAKKMYLTEVYGSFSGDTFFDFDASKWDMVERDAVTCEDCAFTVYERKTK